jgi:hypothetical protein
VAALCFGLSLLLLLAGVQGDQHHQGGLFIIFPFDRPELGEMNCAGRAVLILGATLVKFTQPRISGLLFVTLTIPLRSKTLNQGVKS